MKQGLGIAIDIENTVKSSCKREVRLHMHVANIMSEERLCVKDMRLIKLDEKSPTVSQNLPMALPGFASDIAIAHAISVCYI